ncbi:MAG: GNAT family N-acetyltransferase [Micrococcales bacterium]|nr:GNAT family N-acetyltransferase [Micrococcales bacterium]
MSEISVRVLGEEEWERYKEFRLKALKESPEAFVADFDTEAAYEDKFWRKRMRRSARLLAECEDRPVGIVSLRKSQELFENSAEIFGLWVVQSLRGTGIAASLVEAAASAANAEGHTQLVYWVGTDNGRAVAFASSYGFRPTEHRRPMAQQGSDDDGDEELAMVLALSR